MGVCAFVSEFPRQQNTLPPRRVELSKRLPKLMVQQPRQQQATMPHGSKIRLFSVSTGTDGKEIAILEEIDSIFDCIDTNGDGVISSDELRAHLVDNMGYKTEFTNYLFEAIDVDDDGEITRQEMKYAFYNFEALSMYMTFGVGGNLLTSRDSFKKLVLSQSEDPNDMLLLKDMADLIFEIIDTDNSGTIDRQELFNHFKEVTSKFPEGSTEKQAQEYVKTMFNTLDVNNDGVIERKEMRDAFEQYDFKHLVKTFGLSVYRSEEE